MKKTILLSLFLLFICAVQAQNCSPDTTITKPGIYPEYLDTGMVGQAYEHVFQILSIKDTMVPFGPNIVTATVDSISIDSIVGIPASFSYGCEPANCVYTWENVGCAKLSGTPTTGDIGTHPLEIHVTYYASYGSFKIPVQDTIDEFSLVIESSASGVSSIIRSGLIISPNPSHSGIFYIQSSSLISEFRIYDAQGQVLQVEELNGINGSFDISSMPRGIYFLELITDSGRSVHRLMY
jgi:hypothetical protein